MAFKIGLEGKLYRGASGSTASSPVENVKDLSIDMDAQTATMSNRAGGGWESSRVSIRSLNITWSMIWNSADADCLFFKNALINGTVIALNILDDTGGKGPDGDFVISKFGRNEPLLEGMEISVEAKVNTTSRAPTWPD